MDCSTPVSLGSNTLDEMEAMFEEQPDDDGRADLQAMMDEVPEVPGRGIKSRGRQGKPAKSAPTGPQADLSSVAVKAFAAKVFEAGESSDAESELSRCPEAEAEIPGIKQTEATAENLLDLALLDDPGSAAVAVSTSASSSSSSGPDHPYAEYDRYQHHTRTPAGHLDIVHPDFNKPIAQLQAIPSSTYYVTVRCKLPGHKDCSRGRTWRCSQEDIRHVDRVLIKWVIDGLSDRNAQVHKARARE